MVRHPLNWLGRHPWVVVTILCFTTIAGSVAVVRGESRDRVSQFCLLAERNHLADIERLTETYEYLDGLDARQLNEPINAFVIRLLPERERAAAIDTAPPICDEDGMGLHEPDPDVPERPYDLRGPEFPPPPK